MSQITFTRVIAVTFMLSALVVAGCGDTNSLAKFNSESGKHVAGWLPSGHKTTARADVSGCAECHGEDFQGGISKVSCTSCHLGNETSKHPLQWGSFAYYQHKIYVNGNGTVPGQGVEACKLCHGSDLLGIAGNGPSCGTNNCHLGGTATAPKKHPANWYDVNGAVVWSMHKSYVLDPTKGDASCRNIVCHGANLQGVFLSGPKCTQCHAYP